MQSLKSWLKGAGLGAFCVGMFACAQPVEEAQDQGQDVRLAPAPLIGRADGGDSADYDCQIILRDVQRYKAGADFETVTLQGQTWYVWHAFVDVLTSAVEDEGASPAILLQGRDGQWYEVSGQPVAGAPDGFSRYHMRLAEHTIGPGMTSTTGLAQYELTLIPFLRTIQGSRHFDHNRVPNPVDAYRLGQSDQWTLLDDAGVCGGARQADTTIQLRRDWQNVTTKTLRQGQRLAVVYDRERLTTCQTRRYGRPTWSLTAHARFLPSNQVASQPLTVTQYEPLNDVITIPAIFDVPADATRVELWVEQSGYHGAVCQAWDSSFGQNHRVEVAAALHPGWVGEFSKKASRASSHPCDDAPALGDGFTYGTWERSRAASSDVCLQLWQAGVTDRDGAGADSYAVIKHYRYEGTTAWLEQPLRYLDRVGNNARYTTSMRNTDPFPSYGPDRCASVPVTFDEQGQMSAAIEFYYTVQGVEHRPSGPGSTWRGVFVQYAAPECLNP